MKNQNHGTSRVSVSMVWKEPLFTGRVSVTTRTYTITIDGSQWLNITTALEARESYASERTWIDKLLGRNKMQPAFEVSNTTIYIDDNWKARASKSELALAKSAFSLLKKKGWSPIS